MNLKRADDRYAAHLLKAWPEAAKSLPAFWATPAKVTPEARKHADRRNLDNLKHVRSSNA